MARDKYKKLKELERLKEREYANLSPAQKSRIAELEQLVPYRHYDTAPRKNAVIASIEAAEDLRRLPENARFSEKLQLVGQIAYPITHFGQLRREVKERRKAQQEAPSRYDFLLSQSLNQVRNDAAVRSRTDYPTYDYQRYDRSYSSGENAITSYGDPQSSQSFAAAQRSNMLQQAQSNYQNGLSRDIPSNLQSSMDEGRLNFTNVASAAFESNGSYQIDIWNKNKR